MDQNDNDMKRYSKMNLTMTNMLRPEILMTALDSFTCLETFALQLLFIPIHFYFPFFFVFLTRPLSLSLSTCILTWLCVCVTINSRLCATDHGQTDHMLTHRKCLDSCIFFFSGQRLVNFI